MAIPEEGPVAFETWRAELNEHHDEFYTSEMVRLFREIYPEDYKTRLYSFAELDAGIVAVMPTNQEIAIAWQASANRPCPGPRGPQRILSQKKVQAIMAARLRLYRIRYTNYLEEMARKASSKEANTAPSISDADQV